MMTGDFLRAPLIPHSETSLEDARPIFGPLPVSDKEFIVVISRSICVCQQPPPSHALAFSFPFCHSGYRSVFEHEDVQTLAIICECMHLSVLVLLHHRQTCKFLVCSRAHAGGRATNTCTCHALTCTHTGENGLQLDADVD